MIKNRDLRICLLLICCTSCVFDPPLPHVRIDNASNDSITINVNYNASYLSTIIRDDTCMACYLNRIHIYDSSILLVDFDTTNLNGTYKIAPDGSFRLLISQTKDPGFEFNSIRIFHDSDTLEIAGTARGLETLERHRWQVYVLDIN